jgi:thymidylate kinase
MYSETSFCSGGYGNLKTILVTLSGTHGSGKSTNASRVYYLLNSSGRRFSYLRHQDILDPFGFIVRRMARILDVDVNYLEASTPLRILWSLYFLLVYYPILKGGIALRRVFGYNVVSDRYLYDMMIGFWGAGQRVPLEHLLLWVLPHPDVSFVFEADEKRILENRPEHSADFIRNEIRLYNQLVIQLRLTKIVTSESIQAVWKRVATQILSTMDGVPPEQAIEVEVPN